MQDWLIFPLFLRSGTFQHVHVIPLSIQDVEVENGKVEGRLEWGEGKGVRLELVQSCEVGFLRTSTL